jgi:hypothetical protein
MSAGGATRGDNFHRLRQGRLVLAHRRETRWAGSPKPLPQSADLGYGEGSLHD